MIIYENLHVCFHYCYDLSVFITYPFVDNMLEDSVLFEENEAQIKLWQEKERSASVEAAKSRKPDSVPSRSVGSRSTKNEPLRSPGVVLRPRRIEKTTKDSDDDDYDDDDFKDTFKDTFKDATPAINRCKNDSDVPITTKSRPSTAPVTKPVRCSYVKTTDGLIPEAEAKAKLKQERSKLLIAQKRKRKADMAKKKEDDLAAKEKLSRNKKVSVAEVGEL